MMKFAYGTVLLLVLALSTAKADEAPNLEIVWPVANTAISLGNDTEKSVGVVVKSNFRLMPAGQCGGDPRCGHIHMKIDPDGDTCNVPGKTYNSMNSDFGGNLIKANFGYCAVPSGKHVIGILLADDHHQPVLSNGKPVTALIPVTTR